MCVESSQLMALMTVFVGSTKQSLYLTLNVKYIFSQLQPCHSIAAQKAQINMQTLTHESHKHSLTTPCKFEMINQKGFHAS